MYIRYDSEGRITACSAIAGVLSGENVLAIPDGEVPEDLLETFALGRYQVRGGRLAVNPSYRPEGGIDDTGAPPQTSDEAPAEAAQRKPKKRRGGG